MSEHLWFYELLNEIHGPVSTDDIQQMVADGQLAEDDRIRLQSSEDWITVTDLKTLVENVASGEDEWEEVTDLDDLNFTFEDSSAGVARATENSDHELEEIDDRHSGLDIDSFQLIGDPEEARHSAFKSVVNQSTDADAANWLVQSLGQQLGPMTIAELQGMAEAGALAGTDEVKTLDQHTWSQAESIPEVAASLAQAAAGALANSSPNGKKTTRSASGAGSKRKGKPSSKSTDGTQPGRKRRRKKKRSKKDQLLAEIFSDVFAEDGKVRDLSERPDLANPAAQTASFRQPTTDPAVGTPSTNQGMAASPAAVPPGFGTDSSPGMAAANSGFPSASPGMPTGSPNSAASFVPPPRGKKKKKSGGGGGGNMSMPEPPVLAAIGGGILVILLGYGAYMGWFTIPGFGVNADAFFTEFEAEFPKVMNEDLPEVEWQAFRTKYLLNGRAVAKSFTGNAGADPAAAKSLNKALLIIRILEIKQSDSEARKKSWDKYLTL